MAPLGSVGWENLQDLDANRCHEPGRDAFHRVPDLPFREAQEIRDGVESVPTGFMGSGVKGPGLAVPVLGGVQGRVHGVDGFGHGAVFVRLHGVAILKQRLTLRATKD